jgi:hypothetical protein
LLVLPAKSKFHDVSLGAGNLCRTGQTEMKFATVYLAMVAGVRL